MPFCVTCFYILVRHLSGNSSPLPKMLPKVRKIDMKDSLGYVCFLAMFAFYGQIGSWVQKLKTANENTSLILARSFLYPLTASLHSGQTSRQFRADSKSRLSRRIARASGTFLKRFSQSSCLEPGRTSDMETFPLYEL